MKIIVKLFAAYQEAYGVPELELEVEPEATVGTLGDRIRANHPELIPLAPVTRYGVNLDFVETSYQLSDGDEVVVIPPVSGG